MARFFYLAFMIISIFSFNIKATDEIPKNLVRVHLDSFIKNQKTYLALNFTNAEGWHTYWKNPGDAGLAIKVQLFNKKTNKEIKLNELEWPIPGKFRETGDQIGFGYKDNYTLFYEFNKAEMTKLRNASFEVRMSWLICKHVCVPGQMVIPGEVNNHLFTSSVSSDSGTANVDILNLKMDALPKIAALPTYLKLSLIRGREDKTLEFRAVIDQNFDKKNVFDNNLILTYPSSPFDFTHEEFYQSANQFMAVTPISWDGEYSSPPVDLPVDGKFKKPYVIKALFYDPIIKKTYVIEKEFKEFQNIYEMIPNQFKKLEYQKKEVVPKTTPVTESEKKREDSSLFYYMILGFIGGLILNIMPCVLPVISLKLFELIKYRQESRKSILRHNIFYTFGILFTFLLLALTIVALKSFGTEVGWGFQLQSPRFILMMMTTLFIFALNLFGLFEFRTPGGKFLGNVKTDSPFVGDFLSGILATILSTPCSAPFLGTALTFAFTSPIIYIITVFFSIGIGLAFPFIITGFFPRLIHIFPKPGMWMITFKKIMGFTLILTIVWLMDVYVILTEGSSNLHLVLILLTLILFAFLIFKEKRNRAIVFVISLGLFVHLMANMNKENSRSTQTSIASQKINWEPWSPEKMIEAREKKQLLFIDFTAKWCFTCKVNERLVLDTDDFHQLAKEYQIRLMIADWTKRDEIIGKFLMNQGLVGVPAYFIQKADGTLISLGETITLKKIESHLK